MKDKNKSQSGLDKQDTHLLKAENSKIIRPDRAEAFGDKTGRGSVQDEKRQPKTKSQIILAGVRVDKLSQQRSTIIWKERKRTVERPWEECE